MAPPAPLVRLLRCCARIDLDADAAARLTDTAADVQDWTLLGDLAEEHGLVPLVRRHLRQCDLRIPGPVAQQLAAMAVRHRDAGRVQTATLLEVADAFDAAGIAHVALKGAVLAYDIYPQPELRPRRDIDVLVPRASTGAARTALERLGFHVSEATLRGDHHHLPAMVREANGYAVSIEVHDDALSRDQRGSIGFTTFLQPLRDVVVEGRPLKALGHVDALRHLAAHLLEPRLQTRLLGVVDFVGYAARHASAIDWTGLRQRHPSVVNALSLMHYVTPLPSALEMLRPAPALREPEGIGCGFPPLGIVHWRGYGTRHVLRQLLYPSEWWMRAYYGVSPGNSLAPVRWGRHLTRVAYWGLRRLSATDAQ